MAGEHCEALHMLACAGIRMHMQAGFLIYFSDLYPEDFREFPCHFLHRSYQGLEAFLQLLCVRLSEQ